MIVVGAAYTKKDIAHVDVGAFQVAWSQRRCNAVDDAVLERGLHQRVDNTGAFLPLQIGKRQDRFRRDSKQIIVGHSTLHELMPSATQPDHSLAAIGEAAAIGIHIGMLRAQDIALRVMEPGIDKREFITIGHSAAVYHHPMHCRLHLDKLHAVAERPGSKPHTLPLAGKDLIPRIRKHVVEPVATHADHPAGLPDGKQPTVDLQHALVVEKQPRAGPKRQRSAFRHPKRIKHHIGHLIGEHSV